MACHWRLIFHLLVDRFRGHLTGLPREREMRPVRVRDRVRPWMRAASRRLVSNRCKQSANSSTLQRIHDVAGFAVQDDFRRAAEAGGYHRFAGRHGFQIDGRKWIDVNRGHGHHIRQLIGRPQLGPAQPTADGNMWRADLRRPPAVAFRISRDVRTRSRTAGHGTFSQAIEGEQRLPQALLPWSGGRRPELTRFAHQAEPRAQDQRRGFHRAVASHPGRCRCERPPTGGISLSAKAAAKRPAGRGADMRLALQRAPG